MFTYLEPSLSPAQFGFIPGRSCIQQLLTTLSILLTTLYTPHQYSDTDIIFLDFKKAFDQVPHEELLIKLWNMGVTGSLWSWFCSYLSQRLQAVCIDGAVSSFLPVTSGVPWGSMLGPLLFIVYINDLPNCTTFSSTYLFADDSKCIGKVTSSNDSALLLHSLHNWSSRWNLSFNTAKCKLMHFSHATVSVASEYNIDNTPVEHVNQHRDLGIILSTDLSWKHHYNHMISRAYKTLHFVRCITSSQHSPKTKLLLYITLVRSKICYCSQIWRPHLMKDIKAFEQIQQRATKYIL